MTKPSEHAALVHAIAVAFARSRVTPTEWLKGRRTGRLNARAAYRTVALNDRSIFQQRRLPGATRVNVHILVDGSYSMNEPSVSAADRARLADPNVDDQTKARIRVAQPRRIDAATRLVGALYDALHGNAQVNLNVWMHHTGNAGERSVAARGMATGYDLIVKSIVRNGKGHANIDKMGGLIKGANGDGYVLRWLQQVVRKEHRSDTVDLVIVISDGLPSWSADSGYFDSSALERDPDAPMHVNEEHVRDAVTNLRASGTSVLSVSIIDNPRMPGMYGGGNVIPFDGDWNQLAVDFGAAFGRVLANASEEAARKVGR